MRKFPFLLLTLLLYLPFIASSQVLFSVDLQADGTTYLVKMRPQKTYKKPMNITNSAQCSFVVPTGGFRPSNINNINGVWKNENDIIAPEGNAKNDYIIFNLSGNISDVDYEKGKEIPLFTFQNIGKQTGELVFISEEDINFFKSQKINIGNQLSVLGAGYVNAFSGTYQSATDEELVAVETEEEEEYEEFEEEQERSDVDYAQLSGEVFELTLTYKHQMMHLEWLAGLTLDTESFVIEKSMDGVNFEPIQKISIIPGYFYKETDNTPDYGVNYYRIRQQFHSGEFRYSPVEQAKYYIDENAINMYPNPVRDYLSLRIGHFEQIEGQVHIFNTSGLEMAQAKITKDDKMIQFQTATFPGGIYYLVIQSKNTKIIERQFVVENGK